MTAETYMTMVWQPDLKKSLINDISLTTYLKRLFYIFLPIVSSVNIAQTILPADQNGNYIQTLKINLSKEEGKDRMD